MRDGSAESQSLRFTKSHLSRRGVFSYDEMDQRVWSCPINAFLIQFGHGKESVPCIGYMESQRVSHNDAGTLYKPVSLREMVHLTSCQMMTIIPRNDDTR